MSILFLPNSNFEPTSSSLCSTGVKCSIFKLFNSTLPAVIVAMQSMVPASILSGITLYATSFKLFTPSIFIMFVPAPVIFAPILFKKFCKSTISGSIAAFVIIVFPSAKTDASIEFSVAPTDGKSKSMLFPKIFSHEQ